MTHLAFDYACCSDGEIGNIDRTLLLLSRNKLIIAE